MKIDLDPAVSLLEAKGLSRREAEVLIRVAQGKSNIAVGKMLFISSRTVSKHLEHIYTKLNVGCRTAAVVHLIELLQQYDEGRIPRRDAAKVRPVKKVAEKSFVLLVDDDHAVRGLFRALLEGQGYRCAEVNHGAEALSWLESQRADLVITDNRMPVLGGIAFLESLASKDLGVLPQVIVHSGNLTEELKDRAVKAGAYAVVPKPCDFKELLAIVADALEKSSNP